MKTTEDRFALEAPHADSRNSPASANAGGLDWTDLFDDEITRVADMYDGDTRLGSCTKRPDGQFEAHDANGQLIGIFPHFGTAFKSVLTSGTLSSADELYYGEDIGRGDTTLGSCSPRSDGQFEALDANGQLIGIFPDFGTGVSAVLALGTPSSADDVGGDQ
jgi:hypothetical protein